MGIRVGRRLGIAGLLFGLAACNAAADPLDELAVGERGRVVRVVDGDALALDTGQSVRLVGVEAPPHRTATGRARLASQIVEGVAGISAHPRNRKVRRGTLPGAGRNRASGRSVSCATEGSKSAIRSISKSSIATQASGISPAFIGSPTIRSKALRNLPSA